MIRTPGGNAGAALILSIAVALSACESGGSSGGAPVPTVGSATKERSTGAPVPLAGSPIDQGSGNGAILAGPEIYRGKGVAAAGPAAGPGFEIGDGGEVTLNFVNADIREAIDTILGDILGVTYVIDPRVTGTVTIRTTKPIAQAALVSTLENLLSANGAALVASDGGYKVLPIDVAATGLPPTQVAAAAGAFGIHVVPLKFASAANLQETLQPLIPAGAHLARRPEP